MRALTELPMKRLVLATLLALASGGCASYGPMKIEGAKPGDLTFLWSFWGQGCSQVPVDRVVVTLAASDGTPQPLGYVFGLQGFGPNEFPCNQGGIDGLTIPNRLPDVYTYSLSALDAKRNLLFTADGTVNVDGSQIVSVTLA